MWVCVLVRAYIQYIPIILYTSYGKLISNGHQSSLITYHLSKFKISKKNDSHDKTISSLYIDKYTLYIIFMFYLASI